MVVCNKMTKDLSETDISAVIEMALSDDVSSVSYTHLRAHETG